MKRSHFAKHPAPVFACLLLALLTLACSTPALSDTDSRDPETIVRDSTRHALDVLNERRDEFLQDPSGLHEVIRKDLLPLIDMEYSSRLILGRSGRSATPEQVSDFAHAMGEVLINRYADGLLAFKSTGQMEVLPVKGDNSDKLTRVRTRIRLSNGSFAPVDFAFRKTDRGWKAFDITVEGISYVITYRNQVSPMVQERGIEKVTTDLLSGNIELGE